MSEISGVIAQLSALTFILTSMLAMGMSLTVKQIVRPAAQYTPGGHHPAGCDRRGDGQACTSPDCTRW